MIKMTFNYVVDHIPVSTPFNRRPALRMAPTSITIHNTSNPSSSARNERSWLTNKSNNRQASYHIVVDEREAIECLPLNENSWHAGDGSGTKSGNRTSIAIEICESGNYAKTLENAAELVANMLRERGWGIDRLRRHWDWSGKVCPRLMYDGGKWTGWEEFKQMVRSKINAGGEKALDNVTVNVNGKKVADGVIIHGLTMVPARAVAEALGASVDWDGTKKQVDIVKK